MKPAGASAYDTEMRYKAFTKFMLAHRFRFLILSKNVLTCLGYSGL